VNLTVTLLIRLAMMISITAAINPAGAERPLFKFQTEALHLCQDRQSRASVCFDLQREHLKRPDWDWCLWREVQPGRIHGYMPRTFEAVIAQAHALGDQLTDGDGARPTVCIEGLLRGTLG
jgi:hypothetical protein